MLNRTFQRHASSSSAIPPNSSLMPRGFGLRYIWVRLRVYLILIAFVATSFEAVAAAMVNLYGRTVLIALFWILIALSWVIVSYEALPKKVRLLVNQKRDKLSEKEAIVFPQGQIAHSQRRLQGHIAHSRSTWNRWLILMTVALGLLGWYWLSSTP